MTLADIKSGMRIADIGCGTGVLFSELLSRNPSLLLGIDLSDGMINKAKSKYSDNCLELVACDLFAVDKSEFDMAILYNTYPHFLDKGKLAQKLNDMLKSGGRFVIAHDQSKETINGRHSGKEADRVSSDLLPAPREAENFKEFFTVDILVDTAELYMISGMKK